MTPDGLSKARAAQRLVLQELKLKDLHDVHGHNAAMKETTKTQFTLKKTYLTINVQKNLTLKKSYLETKK